MNQSLPLLTSLMLLLASCGPPPIPSAEEGPPPVELPSAYEWITPAAAELLIASNPNLKIADVRAEDEIRNGDGWIARAHLAPYLTGNRRYLETWEKEQPWLIYCALGPRSELTAAEMATMGFKKVYLLKGGFNAWLAERRAVQK